MQLRRGGMHAAAVGTLFSLVSVAALPPSPRPLLLGGIKHHGFVPALQVPAETVSPGQPQINAVTDLGPNNPSKQCSADGTSCNYHYARGDAGWISAVNMSNY
eukprot:COSAG01_NODE_2532_length_7493_cov_2.416960_7_plen_103_part_00